MKTMLEREMEEYLLDNDLVKLDEEGIIDSTEVIDCAVNMGYEPYLLQGDGDLHSTLLFVLEKE